MRPAERAAFALVLLRVVRPEGPLFLLALLPTLGIDHSRRRAALPDHISK